ncbi:MAG: dimethylargininase [Chloroflexi bacterium]|nr:dimethylargininase [Chloroflexota bacterium]
MLIAITRKVSNSIAHCELTHLERQPVDLELARRQHRQYEKTLEGLGFELHSLPEEPRLPDAVFVEDAAIVLDECAIITRPGAGSRRLEVESVAAALRPYRDLVHIQPPGTLDGGDVLRVGSMIYVGLSRRSNSQALEQLRAIVRAHGYEVTGIPVGGCLHLKSAVTQVAEKTLLLNPGWVAGKNFPALKLVEVDPAEPAAANALMVGSAVIHPAAYPRTGERLEKAGIRVLPLDVSEIAKAEGGVTCCSLLFRG